MVIDDFDEIMNMQRQLASRVVQENEMELQVKLLNIIQSVIKGPKRQAQVAEVFMEAEMQGISEDQTSNVLKTLEDLGYVRRVGDKISTT